jgi:hypothetical protein
MRREVQRCAPTMNGPGKSDSPIVPGKSPNKAGQPAAEEVEGRGLAKGNLPQHNAPRTQRRQGAPNTLERVPLAAKSHPLRPVWRHYPRQEPDAVMPYVRIAGGVMGNHDPSSDPLGKTRGRLCLRWRSGSPSASLRAAAHRGFG